MLLKKLNAEGHKVEDINFHNPSLQNKLLHE